MAAHRYTVLDVFTDTPLEGNGLAVVHDADGLDDATMHKVARETRLSETTFLQAPTEAGADYRNRIWTVAEELPFAGHPSLGTAVAVARARGETEARYVQQTPAGLQPIDVRMAGDARAHASMLQEPASLGAELPAERVLATVGLSPEEAHPDLPAQIVSTGVAQLLAPVREPAALGRAQPDWPAIDALLFEIGAVAVYLAWCEPERGEARARSFPRGFAAEDPATGSAAGPLCAYLAERAGADTVTIAQGVEMGRPSRLETALEGDRVRVGGDVVAIVDGAITL